MWLWTIEEIWTRWKWKRWRWRHFRKLTRSVIIYRHTTHCQTRGCFLPLFSDTEHTVRHEAWHTVRHEAWHTVRLAWSRRRTQGVKGHGSWAGSRVMRLKARLGVQESNVKSAYGHCCRTVAYTQASLSVSVTSPWWIFLEMVHGDSLTHNSWQWDDAKT